MFEEELIQLRQVKEELQAQMDLQKKLIEQQQEHVDLLERQNRLQEQQIRVLTEEAKAQRDRLGQKSRLLPFPARFVRQPGSLLHQKSIKKPGDQQGHTDPHRRFSSPPVIVALLLLGVLLLSGGGIGIYRVALGHLPWQQKPVPTASTAGSHSGSPIAQSPDASGVPQVVTSTPSTCATTSLQPTPGTALHSNPAKISISSGNLCIQSNDGFQCPYSAAGGGVVPDQLVLASNRTTYSQNEIAQMREYVTGTSSSEVQANPNAEPPSTLRWVLGGPTGEIPATTGIDCEVNLNLTNTGATAIQIPKVGVQLETSPQQNSYQYHLIDVCSLFPQPQERCNPPGGGGGACNFYGATIQLGLGTKNDVYSAVPDGTNYNTTPHSDCGTLTIASAAQVQLSITFSLATGTPNNLIYSILPVFTVITAQGEQTLSLPQLVSTLAYANVNQFSCYGLQGTTFVPVNSPDIQHNWCL